MKYLIIIIWIHWLADFVMQTDEMAKNKSKSNKWLLKHIGAYTAYLHLCWPMFWHYSLGSLYPWILLNGVLHFATDYITSRITSRLWANGEVHGFFVIVGLDQAIHITTLFITFKLMVLN